MAYKPKFAAPRDGSGPAPRQTGPERPQETPRPSKGPRIGEILLAIVVIPVSLAAAAFLMRLVFTYVGAPRQSPVEVPAFTISQALEAVSQSRQAAALEKLRRTPDATESTQAPPPETTQPPAVHPHYSIPEDAPVAPVPDPDRFGASADPAVLADVLAKADWLLAGQKTYFDPQGERYGEEPATKWYLDGSMLALTWKEVHGGSVYTFSEVHCGKRTDFPYRKNNAENIRG